jgi:ubiquinone/menaquinone biosynthesis C-methylase UbiE
MLSHEETRAFHDRFGTKQDRLRIYEDRAVTDLVEHLDPGSAHSVFEFGCGTGRLAEQLLQTHLTSGARYLGVDASSTMVGLARKRLLRFRTRVEIRLTSGEIRVNVPPGSFDRFLSTYVLDLLTEDDIQVLLGQAYRVLSQSVLLGLVSLYGFTLLSTIVERIWSATYRTSPSLVGGCRSLHLREFVKDGWQILCLRKIARFGVPSEVLVAKKT